MSIMLERLMKRYEGHPVVNNVSLEVANGELFVLLGPSGSGKSTVLRMIAGLTELDQGRILLHGRDVTRLLPQQRDTGFVFQHYALFKHMSVGDNVEFALRIRKVPATARRRRRDELLELVGLAGLGKRMPHQLSGGQQQRVALARALAHQPTVLLLDEPFGALDAKIRIELRNNLKQVQRELGMTTIFVTHDQEEAFELADRLGVMNAGRLLEVGPPDELYTRPQTEFVATFLGTANLLLGTVADDHVRLGPLAFPLTTEALRGGAAQRVQVLFRPEDIALARSEAALVEIEHARLLGLAEVQHTTFVGSFQRLRLKLPALPQVQPLAPPVPYGGDWVLLEATRGQHEARRMPLQAGDQVWAGVQRMHALTHPGLRILILTDGSATSQAALEVGGQLARLAHARTTILGYGAGDTEQQLQAIREQLGSGLPALETLSVDGPAALAIQRETDRQLYDLLVVGLESSGGAEIVEQQLRVGHHHVLLVPRPQPTPSRVLLCVAQGEPGKEDVRFTGRLARHLGAHVTLLSVVPPNSEPGQRERAERFLEAGVRTLTLIGVGAEVVVRSGAVRDEIMAEMASGSHDLLVLGAPLHIGRGERMGVVGQLISQATTFPVLIVRSRYVAAGAAYVGSNGRVNFEEEVIR